MRACARGSRDYQQGQRERARPGHRERGLMPVPASGAGVGIGVAWRGMTTLRTPTSSRTAGRTRLAALSLVTVAVAVAALAGCSPAVQFPEGEPDAIGVAKAVAPSGDDTIQFVLEGYADGEPFANAVITVGPETVVGDSQGRPIDPASLTSGTQVSVWFDICTRSLPPQCQATGLRVDGV